LAPTLLAYRLESSRCHNVTITQEPVISRGLPLASALLLWLFIAWPLIAQALWQIMPVISNDELIPLFSSFRFLPLPFKGRCQNLFSSCLFFFFTLSQITHKFLLRSG
jgi:hypothetical protein